MHLPWCLRGEFGPEEFAKMNEQALQLEAIRQELDDLGSAVGSLYDYLDRGHPNEREEREALARIAEYEQAAAESRAQLSKLLARLRIAAPDAVEEWVRWHIGFCERVIAETAGAGPNPGGYVSDAQVSNYVARETLAEWQKVLAGTEDYVRINSYFLWDYRKEVVAAVEGWRAKS